MRRPNRADQDYTIERIQTHCYVLLRNHAPVGRLERMDHPRKRSAQWQASLDTDSAERPAPFTADVHIFPSFAAAAAWLSLPY